MAEPPISPQSPAGRSICGYEVVEELGAGGMGVVYRAVDPKLGRNVALKVLPTSRHGDPQMRERLLREARAASALDHPNIGTIYGIEELPEGGLCIVMACYEGKTLQDRMARRPLQLSETLRIATETADGLAAAHSAGIIHRDVKPSNIMLGPSGMVKLVDFGLAKLAVGGEETLTRTATVVGTAAYMSPEQARGRPVDARADIWSVGVMLYQMISGRLPFHGPDVLALLYSVVHEDPPPLGASPELEAAVRKALAKNPEERYPSMAEFAAELRRIAQQLALTDGLETQALASAPAVRALPRSGRRRLAIGAAAAALALAGAVAFLPPARQWVLSRTGSPPAPAPHTTVAVLPFSGGVTPDLSALAGGLAQSLSVRLARIEALRDSISVLTAGEVGGRQIEDAGQAMARLGATLVISGTLARFEKGQRLEIEIRDRRRLRPETRTVESALGDVGVLEDRAVAEVARWLELQTDPRVSAALWRTGTSVAPAYEPYLRGVGCLQRWDKPGNLQRALAAFAEAARVDPRFPLAQVGLAEASRTRYTRDKDPADMQAALGYAREALRLAPNLAEAHVALGRVYQSTGQRDLAAIEFQRTLELEPRNPDGLIGTARSYEELGREAEAEAAYRRVVETRPYWWNGYNTLASYYTRKSRWAEAETQYRSALRVTPDNAAVYSNLGAVLARQDKLAEAARMYQKSIELGPGYQAYANLANLHYDQRQFRQAAENYARALALNDRDFRVWGVRGQALRHGGGSAVEAAQCLRRAIALGEQQLQVAAGDVTALGLLAVYHALLGEKEAALDKVNRALTTASLTGRAAASCAIAYELTGDRASAVRWAQKALDTGYRWRELQTDVEMDALVRSSQLRHAP